MSELFPELVNLKGGEKQRWISAHLDLIWSLNDEMGFDKAKELLHMKDGTLVSALQRCEKGSHPAVTNGKRALAKSQYVEGLAYDIEKRMNALQSQFERSQQATVAALELIERVLLMLRLGLTGEKPPDVSKADFKARASTIYVTSSNEQCAPLLSKRPPTKRLVDGKPITGGLLSRGQMRGPFDKSKSSKKTK